MADEKKKKTSGLATGALIIAAWTAVASGSYLTGTASGNTSEGKSGCGTSENIALSENFFRQTCETKTDEAKRQTESPLQHSSQAYTPSGNG